MTARKQKKSILTTEDRLELVDALNKAKSVCDDTLECGSAWCHDVHDAQNKIRNVAHTLGFKQDNWYSSFKV